MAVASSLHSSCIFPLLSPHNLHLSSPHTSFPCSCLLPRFHSSRPRHLLLSHPNSLSFLSATSHGFSFSALLPPSPSRSSRRANARSAAVIRGAFIFEWIIRIFKFFTDTPMKLFVERLEADLNKAAKMVKTSATVVIHVAEETEEFAEQVEKVSGQVQQFAEKVLNTSDSVIEKVDEVFDVIEGEKKLVITSYKIVDNKEIKTQAVANTSTASGNQPTVTVETVIQDVETVVKDVST